MKKYILAAILAAASLTASIAFSATQDLVWDLPADTTGISGYQLRWGTATGNYPNSVYIASPTSTGGTATSLTPGVMYYFVVKSCTDNLCTKYGADSNEVSAIIPLGVPGNLRLKIK